MHPDEPGVYLAGVECDGAMYHSSAFARERDKIRQSVLEGLGWTLFRVWSTDWWTNRSKALENLHQQLALHLETDRQKREESVQSMVERAEDSPASSILADDVDAKSGESIWKYESPSEESNSSASAFNSPQGTMVASRIIDNTSMDETPSVRASDTAGDLFEDIETLYVFTNLDDEKFQAEPDMFYSKGYTKRLSAMIDHVIDTEGPIHEDVLARRIARHHGFRRAGRQIRERVINVAKRRRGRSKDVDSLFFWRKGTVKDHLAPARYKGRDDEMRKTEYICYEEIRAIGASLDLRDDPIELARCIGINRLSQHARERIKKALDRRYGPNV